MGQTLTDSGNVSVPMSSILDALKDVLNEREREALFTQLIGLRPAGVAPGDLITAELFNQMMSDINGLAIRVSALEGAAGGPIIDHIKPVGNLPAASKITIVGSNFRPKEKGTVVSFGNVDFADFYPESDSSQIVLPVPVSLQGLPADLPVSVTSAGKKSNSVTRRFVPQVIPVSGFAHIAYQGAAIGQINIGQTYNLVWRVVSQVTVPQSFELSPVVTVKSGTANAAAWGAGIQIAVDGPVTLEPGQFQDVTMKLTVPAGAGAADIGLRADSTTTSVGGEAAPLSLVVGAAPTVPDPRAVVAAAQFASSTDLGKLTVAGQSPGFRVRPSKSNLPLPMQISTNGQGGGFYLFEVVVEPGTPSGAGGPQTGRWTVGAMPSTRLQVPPSTPQHFEIPITSSAVVDTTTVSYLLVKAKCFSTNTAPSPQFTSSVRLPIAGKS